MKTALPVSALRNLLLMTILGIGYLNAQHVSVFYYPWYAGNGWVSDTSPRYLRGPKLLNQLPMLGHYRNSNDDDAVKQHVEWSTNFGIDNWICSWWGPDAYQSNAIRDYVAPSLVGTNVTFCLFYESRKYYGEGSTMNFGAAEVQLFYDHIKHMSETFFSHPNYWKIGGRPVVVIYLSRLFAGDYATALTRARQDFNVYFIGDEHHHGKPEPERHRLWDAITAYNLHSGGDIAGYSEETGYLDKIKEIYAAHTAAAAENGYKFLPNVIPGYNDRGVRLEADRNPQPRRVHPDSSHYSHFSQMMDLALEATDSELDAITICSWNEWYEDSQIEPTIVTAATSDDGTPGQDYTMGYSYKGYGADYLKVILSKCGRNASVAPVLNLSAPAAGASWNPGSSQRVLWLHEGLIHFVKLEYHDGSGWKTIVDRMENTGTYDWTVPADARQPVAVRVSTVEGVFWSSNEPSILLYPLEQGIRTGRTRLFLYPGMTFTGLNNENEIRIFNTSGTMIKRLVPHTETIGWNKYNGGGKPLTPGVYLFQIAD